MNLTGEQKKIIAYNQGKKDILKIIAFAGTGKTTTLVEYAKRRPDIRFLYISFNKSVQIEASSKFSKNVVCKTAHSLAWWGFGNKYKDRLISKFKPNTIKEVLMQASYEEAKFTIDTLTNYLFSADPKVDKKHIPKSILTHYKLDIQKFIDYTNRLGRLMCDGSDDRIGMLHDGYLKLYQLSKPVLDYDIILLDEAQDINPVIAEIALVQDAGKIIVGDSHQQVYSFRGARDMMRKVKASKTFYLTHSFRFDKNVASVANMILKTFKGESKKVIGCKKKRKSSFDKGYTIISRTNATIFDEAVKLYKNQKISFVGGISGYRFNRITNAFYLLSNKKNKITDPYIRCFKDFKALKEYAKNAEDWEIHSVCKVVEKYRDQIPNLVGNIKKAVVKTSDAKILLATAHKAKGLEWENVYISNDFLDLVKYGKIVNPKNFEKDEFNLIYVAVTRSMGGLKFNKESSIIEFIKKTRELH